MVSHGFGDPSLLGAAPSLGRTEARLDLCHDWPRIDRGVGRLSLADHGNSHGDRRYAVDHRNQVLDVAVRLSLVHHANFLVLGREKMSLRLGRDFCGVHSEKLICDCATCLSAGNSVFHCVQKAHNGSLLEAVGVQNQHREEEDPGLAHEIPWEEGRSDHRLADPPIDDGHPDP